MISSRASSTSATGAVVSVDDKRITLPALLPFAIPGLANLWLNATKDTSLIAVVGYTELTLATKQAAGNTKMYFLFFMVAAAIYMIITLVSKRGFSWLERRVRLGERQER